MCVGLRGISWEKKPRIMYGCVRLCWRDSRGGAVGVNIMLCWVSLEGQSRWGCGGRRMDTLDFRGMAWESVRGHAAVGRWGENVRER